MSKLASASNCQRALALTAGDTRIKHRLSCLQRRLALAMGLHHRLGQRSVFQTGFEPSLLLTTLGYCEQPTLAPHDFIVMELACKFPGLLLQWVLSKVVDRAAVAACVDRLHSFMLTLGTVVLANRVTS